RWTLAGGAALLALSAYTQPSATLMLPMFLAVTLLMVRTADGWRAPDLMPAACAFVVTLTPLLVWYARFPRTYPGTLGRWLLHPPHVRNPWVWMQAISNWHADSTVAAVFWDFLTPSHLFFAPDAVAFCGLFLSATVVGIAAGMFLPARAVEGKDAHALI